VLDFQNNPLQTTRKIGENVLSIISSAKLHLNQNGRKRNWATATQPE